MENRINESGKCAGLFLWADGLGDLLRFSGEYKITLQEYKITSREYKTTTREYKITSGEH
ncbi:hypothetical protein EG338_12655 [Kaistella haifensis]|nr:hypothetical protein EG338_12655 [Kaistella haifensis]